MIVQEKLQAIIDAILLTAEVPLTIEKISTYFDADEYIARQDIKEALSVLQESNDRRGFELIESASGYRYQSKEAYKQWVTKHWQEKPQRYSRVFLETLALIIYRQPITRSEIEEVRGVAVSSNIIKALREREWIRVVGHKEVPGRPAMFGTTRELLDYFKLKSLDEMPPLAEIQNIDQLYPELDFSSSDDTDDIADHVKH
ncbi:MAG: SMC-Scp complex subunit ScpB [Thiotrichaceae bacterium]|nr:SMC-Scp complex subunit ScpB [Thiotrichaceae bacterium]